MRRSSRPMRHACARARARACVRACVRRSHRCDDDSCVPHNPHDRVRMDDLPGALRKCPPAGVGKDRAKCAALRSRRSSMYAVGCRCVAHGAQCTARGAWCVPRAMPCPLRIDAVTVAFLVASPTSHAVHAVYHGACWMPDVAQRTLSWCRLPCCMVSCGPLEHIAIISVPHRSIL